MTSTPVTREDVDHALRVRFAAPEWALLFEVRNGTGFTRSRTRTADAIAMSLWPSHGLELHGFEVKVSRADWLRERKDPSKADEIAKYCDRWSLVAGDASIVQPGELPGAWGLYVLRGGKLRCEKEPAKLEAVPLDRLLLAGLLRRATEASSPDDDSIRRWKDSIRREIREGAERETAEKVSAYRRGMEGAQQRLAEFERAAGIQIAAWENHTKIGEAVRFVLDGGVEKLRAELRQHVEKLEWMALSARTVLDSKLVDDSRKGGEPR